jgi:hypothetical protein
VIKIAKRKTKTRTITRTVKKVVRSVKKGYSPAQLRTIALTSAGYGAVREDLSSMTKQLAGSIPFVGNIVGTFGDEAVLGAAGYFVAKKMKGKLAKNAGLAMMAVESARVGQALRNGAFSGGSSQSTSSKIF